MRCAPGRGERSVQGFDGVLFAEQPCLHGHLDGKQRAQSHQIADPQREARHCAQGVPPALLVLHHAGQSCHLVSLCEVIPSQLGAGSCFALGLAQGLYSVSSCQEQEAYLLTTELCSGKAYASSASDLEGLEKLLRTQVESEPRRPALLRFKDVS